MSSTHPNNPISTCNDSVESDAENWNDEQGITDVCDLGCQNSSRSESDVFSFKSFSNEVVQNWIHCSFSNSTFQSVSLQHVPSIDRRSTTAMVSINIQSMILGTSVLSFPFAFVIAGIWAIPSVVLIGIASSISGIFLQDCLYQKSRKHTWPKRVRKSYLEICRRAWPNHGNLIMEVIVFMSILRNVIVLILLTNLTYEVCKSFIFFDKRVLTVLWAMAVLPFLFIKRVSSLAWISFIGLSLYLVALVTLVVHCIVGYKTWSFSKLHLEFRVEKFGIAAGIIINSFSQHLAFPPVEGSIRTASRYPLALYSAFCINVIFKVIFGVSAAMMYGNTICQSVTANLTNRNIAIPSNIGIAFFAYFTLPMQSFVVFDLIDSKYLPYFTIFKNSHSWCWLILSRSLVLLPCLFIAVLMPHFGLLVSFAGSIRGSLISLILPPILYMKIFQKRITIFRKMQCCFILFIGVTLGATGIYSSSKAFVELMT